MDVKVNNKHRSFEGTVSYCEHASTSTSTPMKFSIFLPPQAEKGKVPVLYWLSGLTCTEDNFMAKAGAQRTAARLGIALVAPDTSPRGANVPGEDASYDLGTGAGFYVNATQAPWSKNYRMYDYVTKELPAIVEASFPVVADRKGIFGHSMGGHGALTIALKNPGVYRSVSAFAPICAPSQCDWGKKALGAYLGSDTKTWKEYDANELVQTVKTRQPFLIDQGKGDPYLATQLGLETFTETCRKADYPIDVRIRPGYDHGYYYISTFIDEHLDYHAKHLLP